jgi:hypothetical protein
MMDGMSGQATERDSSAAGPGPGPSPPNPYGLFATADGLGGVAAPLLAGFAVTMVALVVQIADDVRWPDVSLVLLGAAAVLLLQVVQLSALARGYAVTPAQAREWYPDIERNPPRERVVNWELRHHMDCWHYVVRRARVRYNVAIILLLCGIAVLLVPKKTAELTPMRDLAIAVIGVGALIEVAAILADWSRKAPQGTGWRRLAGLLRWAAPSLPPVPRRPLPPEDPSSSVVTDASRSHETESSGASLADVPLGGASVGSATHGSAAGPSHSPE